jgi:hypothetical protein
MTANPEPEPDRPLLAVLNQSKVPPGGWSWTDPSSGVRLAYFSHRDLVRAVEAYMVANHIPLVEGWRALLDDEICRQNKIESSHCGQPVRPPTLPADRKLTITDILNFLRTIREWSAKGFEFVSSEEAARRAAICAGCPKNVEVHGCSGCSGVVSHVRDLLNRRVNFRGRQSHETPFDEQLKNCEVCGCVLEVKVHLPLGIATYAKPPGGREYPEHCWMHELKFGL